MTSFKSTGRLLPTPTGLSFVRVLPHQRLTRSRRALLATVRAEFEQSGQHQPPSGFFQELQNGDVERATSSFSSLQRSRDWEQALADREEQLWQRQEALWQQQLAHWQHERSTWAQQEAALLAHIQELHSHLTAISTQPIGTDSTQAASSSLEASKNQLRKQAEAASAQAVSSLPQAEYSASIGASAPPQITQSLGVTPQPAAAMQEASGSASDVQTPQGPPPPLCLGSDDIYWVNQLQSGLMDQGYYCEEEEMEDLMFAEGTQSAVLAFQACCGLEESGVANEATWQALLGDKMTPAAFPVDEGVLEDTPDLPSSAPDPTSPTTPKRNADAKDANPWEASWGDLMSSQESDTEFDTDSSMAGQQSDSAAAAGVIDNMQSSPAAAQGQWAPYVNEDTDYSKWTVLREGDGGRHVHELQAALVQQGFWPGEDDMLWWQFGSDTCSAVQTFQATANLPESGVVTSDTWQALLGPSAKPIDAKNLAMDNETDEDMTAEHAVYLVGEQRWSRRPSP